MPYESKEAALKDIPALKGLDSEGNLSLYMIDKIVAMFDRIKEKGEADNPMAIAISQYKEGHTVIDGEWKVKPEKSVNAGIEAAWVDILREGEFEYPNEAPESLPDYAKRFKKKGSKSYLIIDKDFIQSAIESTKPYVDSGKMKKLTGGSYTNISLYRQGYNPETGKIDHEFTGDGSFGRFTDFRAVERGGELVGQGYLEAYDHAKDVLTDTKQLQTSVNIQKIGDIYPFIFRVTATGNPVVKGMNKIELANSDGSFEVCQSAATCGATPADIGDKSQQLTEVKLADTKVKTAEDYMAEIAEMAKKIEELEAALKNKKVEAAEKETYTKEEAEKMAEEKAEAAVKLAEERAKRNMELAEVTRDIVPAIGNMIKAAYAEPKDGVLELAEGVSVAPKDAVLKIVDAIKKHETKTSAPIVITKSIKASYPDLNKDTQENEDADVAADVKRIEEASR